MQATLDSHPETSIAGAVTKPTPVPNASTTAAPAPSPSDSADASPSERQSSAQAARPTARLGVNITREAVDYAKQRLEQRGTPNAAVRLGVRGGGCSGFSYVIEFSDDPPRARDTVTECDGVRFYVDKKSLLYLGGSTLNYKNTLMYRGFEFLNPKEASKCGCGHSFTVK